MKYDTVIFDLDGTLLYTLEDLMDSTNYVLGKHGLPLKTLEDIRRFIGNGVRRLMALSIEGGENHPHFEEYLLEFREHYKLNSRNKTKPYDGIKELLFDLRAAGIKTAVVSNKFDSAVKELCDYYFDGLFDISAGEKEGVRKKPYPDLVLSVIDALHASPERTVYVGDSEVDIEMSNNSHLDCIAVTWGFRDRERLEECGAKIFADTPGDILRLIK